MGHQTIGLSKVIAGKWRCDVCQRDRRYDEISVAKHLHITPTGVRVEQNVKYCNDTEACERRAKVRSLTELAYGRLQEERDALVAALMEVREKLVWRPGVVGLAAFVAGFVIRGGI